MSYYDLPRQSHFWKSPLSTVFLLLEEYYTHDQGVELLNGKSLQIQVDLWLHNISLRKNLVKTPSLQKLPVLEAVSLYPTSLIGDYKMYLSAESAMPLMRKAEAL